MLYIISGVNLFSNLWVVNLTDLLKKLISPTNFPNDCFCHLSLLQKVFLYGQISKITFFSHFHTNFFYFALFKGVSISYSGTLSHILIFHDHHDPLCPPRPSTPKS